MAGIRKVVSLYLTRSRISDLPGAVRRGIIPGVYMEIDNTQQTVLLVDDEENILRSLKRLLIEDDYNILTASSGQQGLELLDSNRVSLIISDQRMPEMTGSEFLARARENVPEAVRIMLTGYSDINATMEAINKGEVYKYITKPWNDEEMRLTVREAIERYFLTEENKRLARELKEWNVKLEQRVKEQTIDIEKRNKALLVFNYRLKRNFNSCLEAFASLIELRNTSFSNHSKNVAEVSIRIAKALSLGKKEVETIGAAAHLHDIGKIGISDSILQKESKGLTSEEKKEVEQHPVRGQAAVGQIEELQEAGELIRHHHEWYNGNGYPDHLSSDMIPLGARIIGVADAVDRLANPGQGGGRYDFKGAISIVKASRNTKYDPKIVDIAEKIVEELENSVYRDIGSEDDGFMPGDLVPGMILSRDVRSGTGVLILPSGSELTFEKIEHLKRLYKMDPSNNRIYVSKKDKNI